MHVGTSGTGGCFANSPSVVVETSVVLASVIIGVDDGSDPVTIASDEVASNVAGVDEGSVPDYEVSVDVANAVATICEKINEPTFLIFSATIGSIRSIILVGALGPGSCDAGAV